MTCRMRMTRRMNYMTCAVALFLFSFLATMTLLMTSKMRLHVSIPLPSFKNLWESGPLVPSSTLPSPSETELVPGGGIDRRDAREEKASSTLQPDSSSSSSAAAAAASNGADVIIEVDDKAAVHLTQKVRVLVWVMTSPKSRPRAQSVNVTWGRRVRPDILLFVSSAPDPGLPGTVALKVKEGRQHLTAKTMQAFDYVYKHHFQQADFFMKVDDDTYVVMENLRYFLSHQDPDKPFFTGRHFTHIKGLKQGFSSGGAGYVLSRAALARLAARKPLQCNEDGGGEDVNLGRCLEKLGVPILNSDDARGASRFHPYPIMSHVVTGVGKKNEYWFANSVRTGPEWTNEYPITFHYVRPDDMKLLDFFLYRVRPYGINHKYI